MTFQSKKLLAIDASTQQASVALSVADKLYSENIEAVAQHAQTILPIVERLLSSANVTLAELDGIIFGRGPGSFTGIRIACSIAKALAFAHNLPLYGVSGLAAIAHHVFSKNQTNLPVLSMIDARMNQIYWAFFSKNAAESSEELVTHAKDIMSTEEPFILAGVGFEPYIEQLPAHLRQHMYTNILTYPESAAMIELVQLGIIPVLDVALAAPVYIRNQVTSGVSCG